MTTLYYFPIRGLAEMIRVSLSCAGTPCVPLHLRIVAFALKSIDGARLYHRYNERPIVPGDTTDAVADSVLYGDVKTDMASYPFAQVPRSDPVYLRARTSEAWLW